MIMIVGARLGCPSEVTHYKEEIDVIRYNRVKVNGTMLWLRTQREMKRDPWHVSIEDVYKAKKNAKLRWLPTLRLKLHNDTLSDAIIVGSYYQYLVPGEWYLDREVAIHIYCACMINGA